MPLTPANIQALNILVNIPEEDYNVLDKVSPAVKGAVDGLRNLLK